MPKQSQKIAPVPNTEEQPIPDWLQDAHRHFLSTGFYRPEDVQRVIGDQRDGVEVLAESDFSFGNYFVRA